MTKTQIKTRVGLFLIISHFTIVILVVILSLFGGYKFEEMTTTIALIVPMFSVYTTAIIKYIIKNSQRTKAESDFVTKEFAFITFFIPSLFVALLAAITVLKSLNIGFKNFEQFKTMLAICETVFGAYIGLLISSLFHERS